MGFSAGLSFGAAQPRFSVEFADCSRGGFKPPVCSDEERSPWLATCWGGSVLASAEQVDRVGFTPVNTV